MKFRRISFRAVDDPAAPAPAAIAAQPEVREELRKSAAAAEPRKPVRRYLRLFFHAVGAAGFLVAAYLVRRGSLGAGVAESEGVHRVLLGCALTLAILAIYEISAALVLPRIRNAPARFNVRRVMKLLVAVVLILSLVPLFFVGWYAAVVSVGLLSLMLGLALQTPITSFFA